ncbi:hypothetical protein ACJX0J_031919, partial [Zea mays]
MQHTMHWNRLIQSPNGAFMRRTAEDAQEHSDVPANNVPGEMDLDGIADGLKRREEKKRLLGIGICNNMTTGRRTCTPHKNSRPNGTQDILEALPTETSNGATSAIS